MSIESNPNPKPKAEKRRQHVANVNLTTQQVGYAMLNGLTKEQLVEKAVEAYCSGVIPAAPAQVRQEIYLKPPVAEGSPCG